jgi:hypothetical protein
MNLPDHPANTRTIAADNDEKVLSNESHLLVYAHDFDVSESLAVRTHLILAFHDKDASSFEGSMRLLAAFTV